MLVRKLRLERGWSQDELATMTDLSVRTIQRIERGQPASLESQKALAAIFDTEPSVFAPARQTDTETPMSDPAPTPETTDQTPESQRHSKRFHVSPEEARALSRIRRKRFFYIHLMWYGAVMILLMGINLAASPGRFWAIWPMLGWGFGIAAHAITAFGMQPLLGPDWERRQLEKELGRKL